MKFSTPKGTGILRGDQLAARECYNISTRGRATAVAQTLVLIVGLEAEEARVAVEARGVEDFDPRVGEEQDDIEPVEELDEIQLDPGDQSRMVRIVKKLIEKSR